MAATRKQGAAKKTATKKVVKKAAPKKAAPKKAPPKRQPSPKARARKSRGNREAQDNSSMVGAEVAEDEKLSDILGEGAARRILLLQTMFGYERELEDVRVKGAVIAIDEFIAPHFDDFDAALDAEHPQRVPGQVGRPSRYDPSWMLVVTLCLMGAGASKVELVAALSITEETLSDWCSKESERFKPIFSETVALGERLSASWWQQSGRQNLALKGFNTLMWKFNMANRFGWKDKNEIAGDQENPLRTVEYSSTDWAEVEAAMEKKSKQS